MNKRKTILSFLLTFFILFLGMGAYKYLGQQKKSSSTAPVQKEILRQVSIRQLSPNTAAHYISIDGRISAYEQVNLSANVSGILKSNSKVIKKGMFVQKGTLLFDIDNRKVVYSLHAQRSALLNAITLIMPDLKIDYPEAFINWKKYLDEFEVERPIQELPKLTNQQEKYFVAARNIYNLYYNIKSAEAQINDYQIYAPFSGVITASLVFPGTMVMPGQPLATMINAAHYEMEATLSEADLSAVKIGNKVQLKGAATEKTWNGTVKRIGNQIDPITQSIPIYITVSGKGLKEGMYLNGQIEGQALVNVISIPKDLIVNQEYVYTHRDSIIHLQKLIIKNRGRDFVHAQDFTADTWVVMDDPRGLFEGQKVMTRKESN